VGKSPVQLVLTVLIGMRFGQKMEKEKLSI
jgi:hypothetical protein